MLKILPFRLLLFLVLPVALAACGDSREDRVERAREAMEKSGQDVPDIVASQPNGKTDQPASPKPAPENQPAADQTPAAQPDREQVIMLHADEPGPQLTRMVRSDYFHGDEDGPAKSTYYPPDMVHYDFGTDPSRYLAEGLIHNDEPGPDLSRLIPDDYEHAATSGPSSSSMVPYYYEHVTFGSNRSRYMHPDDIDALEARQAGDPDWQEFLPQPPDDPEDFDDDDESFVDDCDVEDDWCL